jgi:hypothetical protein
MYATSRTQRGDIDSFGKPVFRGVSLSLAVNSVADADRYFSALAGPFSEAHQDLFRPESGW